ncbi:hypothetical protein JFV28_12055 [Pseudomonas sp. TH05]|jgi:hypothetical protein|uniref:hypothetical protein n=1 Tax=unclassified Pseudomonas TaxID=196821 RepID=UPI000355087E|nr:MULTISPECIES: hypothetical protein [unclassified Pseudomonas]EPL06889.1 hypothetical protein CF161_18939 [Pseudomonas sp. CF161]MBK5540504.1 hypothetical protein [Pseudomonas sp. TH07]MBK5556597.1 hypothetical protein [Pseudomonas sp. TH05]OOV92063.1 hypothetical protein MF4836_25440 [Pseudomonas sp. MF4836]
MKTLANLAFDYIWHLMFTDDDYLDPDFAIRLQESMPDYFAIMSDAEKAALAQVAEETQARLLAPPDEHGYSPRSLVTADQKQFLQDLISGEFFTQFD